MGISIGSSSSAMESFIRLSERPGNRLVHVVSRDQARFLTPCPEGQICLQAAAEGNPEFATVLKVVRALGLRLHATAAQS